MAKEKTPKKQSPKPSKFTRRMYIPGFGLVDSGDEASKDAFKAWAAWTEVPIENYLN